MPKLVPEAMMPSTPLPSSAGISRNWLAKTTDQPIGIMIIAMPSVASTDHSRFIRGTIFEAIFPAGIT